MSLGARAGTPRPGASLALTMGEPAGIGAEIAIAAWRAREAEDVPPFFLIADPRHLSRLADDLGWTLAMTVLDHPGAAADAFRTALPVLPLELPARVSPGTLDPANAPAVLSAIETAVSLTRAGHAAAVVTGPIHKGVLYGAGFRHPGHTEFLAELDRAGAPPVMLLACPGLKVVPVTVHLALKDAIAALRPETIVHAGRITAAALARDFAIARPRLVVAGLNPHAGEGGSLGREEETVIGPAVAALRAEGIQVTGPMAADSLFHPAARARYDAVLCMYHDQALIPLKTLDFERGVNVTLGLSFIRTSPDHGTALAIAGRGEANPASLIAALKLAWRMARARAGEPAVPVRSSLG
jgi:4-hydroxythreonine-4-phosphate dehydrogenase